ncbi:MAG TPA: hypothetical protein VM509_02490, partial [Planctomycetota bacterium]|nr:hypothetical protein [Planctomycetota bacterium]
ETLRTTMISQRLLDARAPVRTRDEIIAALETGENVNVDGDSWSEKLWDDARLHSLLLPRACDKRPWTALLCAQPAGSLEIPPAHCEHVEADHFWCTSSKLLLPPIEGYLRSSLRWLEASVAEGARIA